ncbi:MAG: hypothetical protein M3042_00690 [Actinomycetota bacterium]|nr:hypothetical protein [Actinomycetota bacterium]
MAEVFLPAHMVASGAGVPALCTRHGQPMTYRRRAAFQSRPPGWTYVLILAGALLFVIINTVLRKTLVAAGWPFCDRCRSEVSQRRRIGAGLMLAGVVLFVGVLSVVDSSSPWVGLAIVGGVVLLICGIVVAGLGAAARVAGGEVSQDGHRLRLRRVAPEFVAGLPAVPPAPMLPPAPVWGPPQTWGPPQQPPPQRPPPPPW